MTAVIDQRLSKKKKTKPHKISIDSLTTYASLIHETHAHIILPRSLLYQDVKAVLYSEKDKPDAKWIPGHATRFGTSSRIKCPDSWLNEKVFVMRKEDSSI
jgi:hypothetical protein